MNGSGAVGQPITLPSGAGLMVNADGSYGYDPRGVFEGLGAGKTATETFTYLVGDGTGATDEGTVTHRR